jgi:transposase
MDKFDGRKLSHQAREALRLRAVQMVESGESPEKVVEALGFHRSAIYQWIAKYREGGKEALKTRPITGRPPKLTGPHLQWLYQTIVGKNPLQLKFEFALWTRDMVRDLIRTEFDLNLSVVSVGRLLHKLGFSPQKPLHRAYQQNPQLVLEWQARELPKILSMAKAEKATLYYADESSVRSDYHSGTTWALKGKTPIVQATGSRFKINILSAISPKGLLRFMTYESNLTAEVFCEFLGRLVYRAENPVYVVTDNHPAHRSKRVRQFVESTKGMLKLFFLPAYSPELNPDELVWADLKRNIGRRALKGKGDLKARVISHLRSLQNMPDKIAKFFHHPLVKYAFTVSSIL